MSGNNKNQEISRPERRANISRESMSMGKAALISSPPSSVALISFGSFLMSLWLMFKVGDLFLNKASGRRKSDDTVLSEFIAPLFETSRKCFTLSLSLGNSAVNNLDDIYQKYPQYSKVEESPSNSPSRPGCVSDSPGIII